jgi:predicted peroxiredoxin
MALYLLIETRSLWESPEVGGFFELATELARASHQVDLFLVQNAVLMARAADAPLRRLIDELGVPVWVDDFSLATRAIDPTTVASGTTVTGIDRLVDLLTRPGCKPIWH